MRLLQRIQSNEIVRTFMELKGNPKACIATEPLWYIPYNLFSPFISVYMISLGLTDTQIGTLLSITMIIQLISSFFGGVITDKFGRRKTTVMVDIISWSIPCFLWAFAQNYWWFVVAAVFNGIMHICTNSWNCLLVEDCEKSKLVNAFSLVQMCGLLAVFFAPLSALLVKQFDLVPVVRCLYLFSCVSMTAKFLLLYRFSTETKQGKKRMEETRHLPIWSMLVGYKDVLLKMVHSRAMLLVLLIMVAYNLTDMVTLNFFSIYATQTLHISDSLLAIFPIIRAGIMLLFILIIQPRVNRLPFRPVMLCGYGLFVLSTLLLIFAPKNNTAYLMFYTLIEACSLTCIVPRKDSLAALFVDEQERSRVTGLMYVVILGLSSPFGYLVGQLSSINRVLPFVFNLVVFAVAIIAVLTSKELKRLDSAICANENNIS
jgi:MFS family permease